MCWGPHMLCGPLSEFFPQMWGHSDYGGRGRFVDQEISLGMYSRHRDRQDIDMDIANVQKFKAS